MVAVLSIPSRGAMLVRLFCVRVFSSMVAVSCILVHHVMLVRLCVFSHGCGGVYCGSTCDVGGVRAGLHD